MIEQQGLNTIDLGAGDDLFDDPLLLLLQD